MKPTQEYPGSKRLGADEVRVIERLCDRFEDQLRAGTKPTIEAYLAEAPEFVRAELFRELFGLILEHDLPQNLEAARSEYHARFPIQIEVIDRALAFLNSKDGTHRYVRPRPVQSTLDAPPQKIGRYQVEKLLGEGGFARVYLAYDDQLKRSVAIKVPRPERLARPQDAAEYLAEARVVAGLDHPNIVPVHDVGTISDGHCYVVSKLIEGSNLAKRIRKNRPPYTDSAGLIATIAEALHYAHRKGLVHRDIKPANILIDTSDKPYVADFGLALKEEDFGKGAALAGTRCGSLASGFGGRQEQSGLAIR